MHTLISTGMTPMQPTASIDQIATQEFKVAFPELQAQPVQQAQLRFFKRLDDAVADALSRTSVACQAGCDHCCHYVIRATGAELLMIRQHLLDHFPASRIKEVIDRAKANVQAGKGLSNEQLTAINLACPFLSAGQCTIYPVRPANCRGYHSTDAQQCRDTFERPQDVLPRKVARAVEDAAGGVLGGYLDAQKRAGLDTREYELSSALVEAMASPQLAQRLKAGKKTLQKARVMAGGA
ncbi:hypothetical protein EYS42_14835 [Aquabacterium lacunae]|uniref:YkgJ family cysteine cluster protein n=2 Tax=Aquabacterium lacunae TaxID=2528630 RepID=A0A4Q9GVX1_9BURK|nr:hypothetical protein EYS42_14835 [Aquabacterium lacunae]